MKLKQYYVIAICLSLFFGSELSAQQHSTNTKRGTVPRLSGRAVRSSHTPGLSSRRRTKLNTQVINSVLKQNTPTKAGQRQISSIERRLLLRGPTFSVIGEGTGTNSGWSKIRRNLIYYNGLAPNWWWISHGPGSGWWPKIYYRPPQ